jgi:hypothetical protein
MKGIKVEGMDHLAGQLKRVMATAQGQELQAALLAAAEEIRGEAARRAPIAPYPTRQNGREIAPGGLRASLKAAAGRKYKTFLQAFTFTLAKLAPHAHLVHFGTKPHAIVPGQGKSKKMKIAGRAFAWLSRVGDQVRTKVFHPGSRPNPFLADAVKAKRRSIKKLLETRVKAAFDALGRAA